MTAFLALSDLVVESETRVWVADVGGEQTGLTVKLFFVTLSGAGALFWRGVVGVLIDFAASIGRVGVKRFLRGPD